MAHGEHHRVQHANWLRAAVLGANDGLISTASLMMGMLGAQSSVTSILFVGVAGLMAGAASMAAGEYVSVHSQSDTEAADLARERRELEAEPESELRELTEIYRARGLDRHLAQQVAAQLTAHDALGAHARDELGMHESTTAKPLQAALASAATFSVGAFIPLLTAILIPQAYLMVAIAAISLLFLGLLGGLAAKIGGADIYRGALRVSLWGAFAMLITATTGYFFSGLLS